MTNPPRDEVDMDRKSMIRKASELPVGSPERREILAKLAGRDPHVEARAMIDAWEDGLRPLFSAIKDIERAFKEAEKTVETLDRQGAGGTLAAPDYLKGVIRPMKATSDLAGLAAKTIEKVVKDAGA